MRLTDWLRRTWYLLNRRRFERDLEREMAAHRAQMPEPHRFGSTLRLREQAADVWGWRWLDELARDVRLGIRQLVQAPMFACTALVTLTLGIGANTAIFSVVNGLLLRPLPVHEPDRLAILGDTVREELSVSYPVWERIRSRPDLFDGASASAAEALNLARGGEAQFVRGLWVSSEFFDVLGVSAALGRTFTADDDRRGGGPGGPVAIISDDFWRRRFDTSPAVLGQSLVLDSVAFTVVGVAPPGFVGTDIGQPFDVAIPIGTEPLLRGNDSSLQVAIRNWLTIVVRLRPGQTLAGGTAALRGIQPQIREGVGNSIPEDLRAILLRDPLTLRSAARGHSNLRDRYDRALVVLLVVVGLVLLIACVNVANLLLTRAVARRQEMSIRLAIGASRARLARMLLAEASLLSVLGGALGLAVSIWLSQLLVRQLPTDAGTVPVDLPIDWRVLAFVAAVSMGTTALFGAVPAWHSTRVDPAARLSEHGRGLVAGRSRITAMLVTWQLALSLVLVVGASLFIRTFAALSSQDLGFAKGRVLVVEVTPSMTQYTLAQLVAVYEQVREAVAAVPGVERAALSDITPVGRSSRNASVDVPGAETLPPGDRLVMVNVVSPGWFATYDTSLLAGRDFAVTDRPNTSPVAVVNEAFVRRLLKGEDPIGRSVAIGGGGSKIRLEIVGLVEDAVYRSLRDPAPPTLYTSTTQRQAARPFARISVRTALGSPAPLTRAIVEAIRRIDPGLTLQFTPLSEQVDAAMTQERLVAMVSGFFGTIALLLAAVGLYGVTAYAASRRRAEIGVRLALGAAASQVVRLVMRGIAGPVAGGIVLGGLLSLWLAQFVTALTWGLEPRDPATLVSAAVVLAVLSGAACWLPAWRASRLDPVIVLRQ